MAAINFPASPADGQEFVAGDILYTYVSAKNLWKAAWSGSTSGGSGGSSTFANLTDTFISSLQTGQITYYNGTSWVNATKTIDEIYLNAARTFTVTNSGNAYVFDTFSNNNPDISATAGEIIAFKLDCTGHPFQIQNGGTSWTGTNLIHVDTDGTVSTGSDAQGKTQGTLYFKTKESDGLRWSYQCSIHSGMNGNLLLRGTRNESVQTIDVSSANITLDTSLGNVFNLTMQSDITSLTISNVPSDGSTITLIVDNTAGNYDITWPSSVQWSGGSQPSLTSNGTDVITLITPNGGTVYYAFISGQGFA